MRGGTKLFLLLGCGFVVALGAPRAGAVLRAGWSGPYGASAAESMPEAIPLEPARARIVIPEPRPAGRLELARR